MPEVTVNQPQIGYKGYFSFKEPFARYIKNRLNRIDNDIFLEVTSISSLEEITKLDLQDAYLLIYSQANISQQDYSKDLLDNVSIITFKYVINDTIRYIKVPLSYVSSYQYELELEYISRNIVIDLGMLYKDFDISFVMSDLSDFIKDKLGVVPEIKEVSLGLVEFVSNSDHGTRETIRVNNVVVDKTNTVLLEELRTKYNSLLDRLTQLNISLE